VLSYTTFRRPWASERGNTALAISMMPELSISGWTCHGI